VPRAEDFLPLTPLSFHVLVALRRGARHGYAIGASIEETSGGALRPTTGSLYQALKRLRAEGLIESAPEPRGERSAGPPRLYFRLSALGRRVAGLEAERLETLVGLAREAEMLR
jgi:DNA-binding PadR family transcriptional regulator